MVTCDTTEIKYGNLCLLTHNGRQLGSSHCAVDVGVCLFESRLDIELLLLGISMDQNEFAFPVECVLQVVECDEMRIAKHGA